MCTNTCKEPCERHPFGYRRDDPEGPREIGLARTVAAAADRAEGVDDRRDEDLPAAAAAAARAPTRLRRTGRRDLEPVVGFVRPFYLFLFKKIKFLSILKSS